MPLGNLSRVVLDVSVMFLIKTKLGFCYEEAGFSFYIQSTLYTTVLQKYIYFRTEFEGRVYNRPEKDQATFVASVSAFPSFHNLTNHTTGYNFALKFAFQWSTDHNLVLFWNTRIKHLNVKK